MEKKIRAADFTLEDFLEQLKQVKNMGPIDQLMGMIPGMNKLQKMQGGAVDEKEMVKVEAIIYSMTTAERRDPTLIDGSRRRRIARGSGTTVQDVNRLLKQFDAMKKMMKQFGGQGKKGKGMDRNLPFLR
jgi:signal recognition particle subunit SRP54